MQGKPVLVRDPNVEDFKQRMLRGKSKPLDEQTEEERLAEIELAEQKKKMNEAQKGHQIGRASVIDDMYSNFQNQFNELLKTTFKEDANLQVETLGDCVRIVEKGVKPWTKHHWISLIDNYSMKDVGPGNVNLQIKLRVLDRIRPRIWFWSTNLDQYDKLKPYEIYAQLREIRSDHDEVIKQDVERTFPQVPYFRPGKKKIRKKKKQEQEPEPKTDEEIEEELLDGLGEGQRRLFYVLRAYVNYDQSIGYTQGMNYLAAGFLCHLVPHKTPKKNKDAFGDPDFTTYDQEVKTFLLFLHVCQKHNWREVYNRKMKKNRQLIAHLEKQMYEIVPLVAEKIKSIKLPFYYFFDSYFLTVMMYRSPIDFCARVLDIFLLEGENIIFEILLRMLYYSHKQIEALTEEGEIAQFFKQDLVSVTLSQFPIKQIIPLNHLEVINGC